ncbi:hypothetical protein CASFOL_008268 [Castilleja foliolosa]|uniref:C2H2-type domain-containing protein n=1 Tax=Castilleja foliolosa TaxID=1961234 RepID=A0ABD3DYH3_9LAMI
MGDHTSSYKQHSYFLRAKTAPRFDKLASNNEARSSISEHIDAYSGPASSEEEDLANCLVMLSSKSDDHKGKELLQPVEKGMFQCKACKKIFSSHQALGGHRASHKKVKGCFAAKMDSVDSAQEEHEPVTPSSRGPTSKRPKMHECSVCHRVFSSGQALGGHKRCHWLTTSSSADNAFVPSFRYDDRQNPMMTMTTNAINPRDIIDDEQDQRLLLDLNLNLPPVGSSQQQRNNDHNGEKGCDQVNKKMRKLSHDLGNVDYDAGWLQMGIG